jgi:hypothetical protein
VSSVMRARVVVVVVSKESEVRSRVLGGMHATREEVESSTFSKRWRRSTEASEHVASPKAGWYHLLLLVGGEGVISLDALSKLDLC